MGDGDKKGSGSPAPLIIAAIVVAVGLVARQFELESRRPALSERAAHYSQPLQTVPARLWQDPLASISELKGKTAAADGTVIWYSAQEIVEQYLQDNKDAKKINVVLVPVFGGPYAEYGEGRRRQRYAIAAGLLESDYAPDDPEKLGVFRHFFPGSDEPLDLPFEWYTCKVRKPQKCSADEHVLAIWVNDDLLGANPLHRLASLFPKKASVPLVKTVIGPAGSGRLIAMLAEASKERSHGPLSGIRMFSPNGTIDPQALLGAAQVPAQQRQAGRGTADEAPAGPWRAVQAVFERAGMTFVSTIGSDDQLARALAREATLRQYSVRCLGDDGGWPPACLNSYNVLVVAEGDTEYARSLATSFTDSLVRLQCHNADDADCRGRVTQRIFRLTYLRGLDGETARAPAGPDKDGRRAAGKADSRALDNTIDLLRAGETAAGNVQFDYLRRLGRSAKALERRAGSRRLAVFHAIAIFGSDAYDKLLVMQALRSEFPSAFFMTTDMDARYLQREQLEWSRNLVVASSFGLDLNRNVREHSAPFRDGYQSAQFLAARLAVSDSCDASVQALIDARLAQPRLFEISTAGPVELRLAYSRAAGDSPLRDWIEGGRAARLSEVGLAPRRAAKAATACALFVDRGKEIGSLHPRSQSVWPWYRNAVLAALVVMVGLAAWYSLTIRRMLRRAGLSLLLRWPEILFGFGITLWALLPRPLFFTYVASAAIAALICGFARRQAWLKWHARRARVRPLFLAAAGVLGFVALHFCGRGWISEPAAWRAAAFALPLLAIAGALAHPRRLAHRRKRFAIGAIGLGVLLVALFLRAVNGEAEEPAGFLNGASSWLSEALRVVALIYIGWAVGHIFAALRANEKDIHAAFFPGQPFPVPPPASMREMLRHPRKWLIEEWKGTDFLRKHGLDARKLWGTYRTLCKPSRLCWRAGIGAGLFFMIFVGLTLANPPMPPVRGIWSSLFDTALLVLSVSAFFFLIFLVVDVVRLTAKFVHYQSARKTAWPQKVLPNVRMKGMGRVLSDTTDLELLSRRTAVVSKLVIVPFVPLLLLVLARHEVVDAWPWTWPMVLLFTLCFAFLILMSVQLRSAAEGGKVEVMERLTKYRLKALGKTDSASAEYLESLIKTMERITTGAYSPLWQAEWLRGLAIPTTGYGAFELLRVFGVL